VDTQAN